MLQELDWSNILTGIGTGVIASLIFSLLFYRVRPTFTISSKIAKTPGRTDDETPDYVVKIINRSIFYKIHDLTCQFKVLEYTRSANALDSESTDDKIILKNKGTEWTVDRLNIRHSLQLFWPSRKLKSRSDYAIQFGTISELSGLIEDKKTVRLEVRACHPLSGRVRVRVKEYDHKNDIIEGQFCSGNTFKIV